MFVAELWNARVAKFPGSLHLCTPQFLVHRLWWLVIISDQPHGKAGTLGEFCATLKWDNSVASDE